MDTYDMRSVLYILPLQSICISYARTLIIFTMINKYSIINFVGLDSLVLIRN